MDLSQIYLLYVLKKFYQYLCFIKILLALGEIWDTVIERKKQKQESKGQFEFDFFLFYNGCKLGRVPFSFCR